MSSSPLVKCKISDGSLSKGNVVIIRLPDDIFGPASGSVIESRLSQRRNTYHHAVVLNATMFLESMHLELLPMPSYSSMDQSKKSSTDWLLTQPDEFQQLHIPVPYEEDVQPHHPPFPTPRSFGDPLHIGGWKDRRPSWVLAVPQVLDLGLESVFKRFEPPVKLSDDEITRLTNYCKRVSSLAISWRNRLPTGNPDRQQGRRSVTMSYEDSHFKDKGADVRLEGSSQVWPYGRNPTAAPTPTSTKPPPVKPTVQFAGQSTTSTVTEDPEREKRRRRAERFGIPLVENSQNPVSGMSSVPPKQIEVQAKQFGTKDAVSKPKGKKRPAPTEDIDAEELERRKKRSERFGIL